MIQGSRKGQLKRCCARPLLCHCVMFFASARPKDYNKKFKLNVFTSAFDNETLRIPGHITTCGDGHIRLNDASRTADR